ncbi:MAG: 4-hydroxythreonine-4-phosphate dehydrogenase PdxA, partial [Hyphomicrobium denitrificans]|nr:4-hydroxythreonine-4-phosphate dehydrogenase PdxA [Hyphomicrobium denitrificans]
MAAQASARQVPLAVTPLALTMGDPAGIGPELAIDAWRAREANALPAFALFADLNLMRETRRALGVDCDVVAVPDAGAAADIFARALPVVDVPLVRAAQPGLPDSQNGPAVILAIRRAVEAVAAGQASAIVTNPIAKSVLYDAGFQFAGHTEY